MTAFFALVVLSAADVAVLRDGADAPVAASVDAMGRTEQLKESHAPPSAPEPGQPAKAARKEPELAKAVARSQVDLTAGAVLSMALLDPFALAMLLLLAAYAAFTHLVPTAKAKAAKLDDAASTVSRSSRKSRTPDRFALVVNQKLVRLDSVDEVLDFALQSAQTGRTDIVNCVTAVHRSAKLMAGKPQVERIRIGQDPRLLELLVQLERFVKAGDNAPAILARAVGNTTWALAKLQFREGPERTILDTLSQVFVEHCCVFRPEELMNSVWAFAELRRDKDCAAGEARVLAVAEAACRCVDKMPDFTVQQVVYLSWALARMSSIAAVKHGDAEVRAGLQAYTTSIVARARPALGQLTTKNLAMLSWAAASLHVNLGLLDGGNGVTALLGEMAQLIAQKGLTAFHPGEIASIVWALNKVSVAAPGFFAAFEAHLLQHGVRGFSTQDISTVLCAFAQTQGGSAALYDLLGAKVAALGKDFNRTERALVLWAYGQLPRVTPPKF